MSTGTLSVTRALISVSDKTGVVEFARELVDLGVEILSTGGTAKLLAENDIAVSEVASKTEFPEIMGGRVKTLHPKIHGGILGRRGLDEQVMQEQGIDRIDMVVVNLYPFAETVAKPACTLENAIENIDIGGPAMLRAAAKNHDAVIVITNPADYKSITHAMRTSGGTSKATRFAFAVKAFTHTAAYDGMISNYLSAVDEMQMTNAAEFEPALSEFPDALNLQFTKVQDMRYGENPHQVASFYKAVPSSQADGQGGVANAHSIQGKALSYNNIADADAALDCVWQFEQPACVIVKHANPCGVALGDNVYDAYQAAYRCDPTSAFGGILAFNREVDGRCMTDMLEQQFVEVVLAPGFSDEALQALKAKPAVRALRSSPVGSGAAQLRYQSVGGGLLVQSSDRLLLSDSGMSVVTKIAPTAEQERDLLFAWQVAKYVKSNAIVYAHNQQTVGIGAGQMSRVYSARIAAIKAADEKLEVKGAVMASDAFFPFRDGIDSAAQVGISAVVQPGGSKNDQQVIDAANEQGLAMVFTGMRHFRH